VCVCVSECVRVSVRVNGWLNYIVELGVCRCDAETHFHDRKS